jgi:predicted outer membrane repeat protein
MRGSLRVVAVATATSVFLCPALPASPIANRDSKTEILITVTNTNDVGPGSLRQALADAQDGDDIQFDPNLNGQTINLTSGELVIDKNITIVGPGQDLLTVSRSSPNLFRIFHVMAGHTVTIEGLTIKNGKNGSGPGGGIYNDHATLTIESCVVANNSSSDQGGGIYCDGSGGSASLTIRNSVVRDNTVLPMFGSGEPYGGGIANIDSTLTIDNSQVTGNAARAYWSSEIYLGNGGGVYNDGTNASLTITNSLVSNNIAGMPFSQPRGHESGISNLGSRATPNKNHPFGPTLMSLGVGYGGGVYNTGTLTITNTELSSNSATFGGGGFHGDGSLTNSTISGNQSWGGNGGGIAGDPIVNNCTISGNQAWVYGGGIYGSPTITNCTISGNHASPIGSFGGGGIYGGGIVRNSTIAGNTGTLGGGIFVTGSLEIGNTVLKTGTSGGNIATQGGTVTSHGYNISNDNGSGFLTGPGDQINTDPFLGPLQDNGGPTLTHALLPGSPAIDAGDPNFTPPPFYDQRGFDYFRVSNGRIDIGSFETQPGCVILYDQTNNAGGGGIISQNFEPAYDAYDAQAADDFVVPAMQTWTIQQVKANGIYFNGPGPATTVNVIFYFDSMGFPGAPVPGGIYNSISMSDSSGNFTITLPTDLILTSGTYWVSVQANMNYSPAGEWAWNDRMVASNSAAVWQNPANGFATTCTTYGRRATTCGIDPTAPDEVFQILGCAAAATPTPTPITISGNVSYCSNPNPGPVPNATLTLTGTISGTTLSDTSGNYSFSVPSAGNYTVTPSKAPVLAGTSSINTVDVIAVQRHFLQIGTPLSGCRLLGADVNGDNSVNTVDVTAIQRFVLALSTGTANVGHYQFTPTNRTYQGVVTNQPNQNYATIVFGDVATPYVH